MPRYDVVCHHCGQEQEIFRRMSEYKNRPFCCGEKMAIKLSPVNVQAEFKPYRSMIDGHMVTDRGEHRRHLREHGCIEIGNEKLPEPKQPGFTHKERDELRKDISARLETIRV